MRGFGTGGAEHVDHTVHHLLGALRVRRGIRHIDDVGARSGRDTEVSDQARDRDFAAVDPQQPSSRVRPLQDREANATNLHGGTVGRAPLDGPRSHHQAVSAECEVKRVGLRSVRHRQVRQQARRNVPCLNSQHRHAVDDGAGDRAAGEQLHLRQQRVGKPARTAVAGILHDTTGQRAPRVRQPNDCDRTIDRPHPIGDIARGRDSPCRHAQDQPQVPTQRPNELV